MMAGNLIKVSLAVSKIATIGSDLRNQTCNPFVFNDGSDLILIQPGSGTNGGYGFRAYRIGTDGSLSGFQTTPFSAGYGDPSRLAMPLGAAHYLVNTAHPGTYIVQIPAVKNGKIYSMKWGFTSLSNPCIGGAPSALFVDAANGYLGAEFIQPFQFASNFFASTYKITQAGVYLMTTGFVGNEPNGSDPYNQTQLNSAPYIGGTGLNSGLFSYQQNGIYAANNIEASSQPYWTTQISSVEIFLGSDTACPINGVLPPPSGAKAVLRFAKDILGIPSGADQTSFKLNGGTDLPNWALFYGSSPSTNKITLVSYAGDFFEIDISGLGPTWNGVPIMCAASVDSAGNVYVANQTSAPNSYPIDIYYGSLNTLPNIPPIVSRNHRPLGNFMHTAANVLYSSNSGA